MRIFYILSILMILLSCDEASMSKTTKMENELLFVGTYTDKEGHVDGHADGIYALDFDPESGQLKNTKIKVKTTNPSYIALAKNGKHLYAVNEKVGEGESISSFAIQDSSLTLLNKVASHGGAPCHISTSDNFLMTANYVGGNHVIYQIQSDGSIGDTLQILQNKGKGPSPRQEAPHAHMITQNPHTSDFLSVDLGNDEISFYILNQEGKKLIKKYVLKMEAGSGPRHVAFHPFEDIIYVLNELSGTVAVAKAKDSGYEVVQSIAGTREGESDQAGSAAIHVHKSGKFLYFSNRGPYNSIAHFNIQEDGLLDFVSEVSSGGEAPRDFTIDPSGNFLLVANQNSDNILVYSIDQESGQVTQRGEAFSAPTPVCLKFL